MARKPRLHVPGGVYHVMLRGNGGQDIFLAKTGRRRVLELPAEGTASPAGPKGAWPGTRPSPNASKPSTTQQRMPDPGPARDAAFAKRIEALDNAITYAGRHCRLDW